MRKLIIVSLLLALVFASPVFGADKKISQLEAASSVAATDVVPIVAAADGNNYKATMAQIKTFMGLSTDNSTANNLVAKDSDGHIENLTLDSHLSRTGTTSPALAVVAPSIIYHAAADTDPTAAQMTGPGLNVSNYGQGAEDVFVPLPAAAAGLSGLFTVATAQASNHWGVQAASGDIIYLIAADGTIAAGDDNAAVVMTAAQLGQAFACWTFLSGNATYDWQCKSIAIGTSTFAAHAAP